MAPIAHHIHQQPHQRRNHAFATATSPAPSARHGHYIMQLYHNYRKLIGETTTSSPRHRITPQPTHLTRVWRHNDGARTQRRCRWRNDSADDPKTVARTFESLHPCSLMPILIDTARARRYPCRVAAHIIDARTHWSHADWCSWLSRVLSGKLQQSLTTQ